MADETPVAEPFKSLAMPPASPPTPVVAPAPSDSEDIIHTVLQNWWQDHVPGSVIARDTEALNYLLQSFTVLEKRLRAIK